MNKNLVKNLFFHISKKRKLQFFFLTIIIIIVSLIEMLSIASVVPFVEVVTSNNFLDEKFFIFKFISAYSKQEAIIVTGVLFSFLIFINSILRCVLIYISSKLANNVTAELSNKIYRASLFDSYTNHINNKTSAIISSVTQKVFQIYNFISGIINITSSVFILTAILSILIWINPVIILSALFIFILLYSVLALSGKKILKKNSQIINEEQNRIVFNIQNGLGIFRDIILDKSQEYFIDNFAKSNFKKARSQAMNEVIQQSPRYIFEAAGTILVIIFVIFWNYFLKNSNTIVDIFPILAALGLGAQKILPLINMLYQNFAILKGNIYQTDEVINILNKHYEREKYKSLVVEKKITFKNLISFKNIFFSYQASQEYILEDINFEIKKGQRIGIVGNSGEGKSTFLDLLMGLLEPNRGSILIDGVKLSPMTISSWQSKISHVPQKLFISDNTFLENIVLGRSIVDIDVEKVEVVSKKAQLHNFIKNLDKGYYEQVGERGVKLSGGQIQRVGLARSLYKNSEIIIFDEATNSLDLETEKLIMKELFALDKNLTIIIVAHRLDTLNECDYIFEVKNKNITRI